MEVLKFSNVESRGVLSIHMRCKIRFHLHDKISFSFTERLASTRRSQNTFSQSSLLQFDKSGLSKFYVGFVFIRIEMGKCAQRMRIGCNAKSVALW